MTGQTYPATPYLERMAADDGWQGQVVRDRHCQPSAIVAVRVGPTWTDAVVIEGEDRVKAARVRTENDGLIVPGGSGVVRSRHGGCTEVLAELLELPQ